MKSDGEIGEKVRSSSWHYMEPLTFLIGSIETQPHYPNKVSSKRDGSKHVIGWCHEIKAVASYKASPSVKGFKQ
jgi:hypothetical protein